MKTVVTGSEMKAIDTYTIQELGIPSLVLKSNRCQLLSLHFR